MRRRGRARRGVPDTGDTGDTGDTEVPVARASEVAVPDVTVPEVRGVASVPDDPPPAPRDRSRVPSLVAVAALVAGVAAAGLVVDRRQGTAAGDAAVVAADLGPTAPAAAALGSTWYCAAGTAAEGGAADHSVTIANLGERAADATITVVPGAPSGEDPGVGVTTEAVTIPPRGRTVVRLRDLVEAPFAAAVVEVGRGEVVVEHEVAGASDRDSAPCASSSSPTWFVPAGATTRDASEQLVLFNPFPDDAVVDVTFTTPDGLRSPPAFAGFIVPGRRVVAVDVGAVVSRHPIVSTAVVARTGRLVVERLQSFDGSAGPAGLAVTPAAPLTAQVWSFPDGLVAEGISEVVTVFNPSGETAEVDVEVDLDASTDPAAPIAADPFELSVPPQSFVQVDVGADGRVPAGRGHALTVRSQNGVGVVAERWVRSAAPAARTGFGAVLGSPVVAIRWLSAVGGATADLAEFLVLVNPAPDGIARVSIRAATTSQELDIAGLEDVEIPGQGRLLLDLGQYLNRADLVLVLESTVPIVAERGLYPAAGGIGQSILVPSSQGVSVPPVDAGVRPAG